MINRHTFHIPVMGIGYTIDTPLRVAHLGIDSAISLVDDMLLERLRKMHCTDHSIAYVAIAGNSPKYRSERITSYLNLIKELVERKFEGLVQSAAERRDEVMEYFRLLPDGSTLLQEFRDFSAKHFHSEDISRWIREKLSMGSIDVNIMTKVDKDNYHLNEKLPIAYNDAHAALRGFAESKLDSTLILSAGMSPRLYSYMEEFADFYPDAQGRIGKKIALKVSDFKSALIQGKYLAKKGLWVSEYRIESGLNCGGHAFATEGFLLGPILAEFRDRRQELLGATSEILNKALETKGLPVPDSLLPVKITAQGGVGTAEEHRFLLEHYALDSIGWGTPFLLVPEVVNIDENTQELLRLAQEEDLYLSNISPLGVPFNSIRGNTKDIEKMVLAVQGKPGSTCPKKYVGLNFEFTEKGICSASRQYQRLKLNELDRAEMPAEEHREAYDKIVEKSCICVGLGTSALIVNDLDTRIEGEGTSVCPGPNMAYFSKTISLREMVDHIYGRANVIARTDRPNMFIKELGLYVDFLRGKVAEARELASAQQQKYLNSFSDNLNEGINYYDRLFGSLKTSLNDTRDTVLTSLQHFRETLHILNADIRAIAVTKEG